MLGRDAPRDRARRRRDRRLDHRPARVQRADGARRSTRGIPVVSYNADGGRANRRLAYVGQDLYQSGLEVRRADRELVGEGDVVPLHRDARAANIQPRVDGALDAIRDSGKPIRAEGRRAPAPTSAASGADRGDLPRAPQLRGMFAVDGGSTQGVAEVVREHGLHRRGVRAGGYDLLPRTLRAIADRHLDFTIDQQPYLQGFLPVLQLFLAQLQRRPRRAGRHEHRACFRHAPQRAPYLTTRTRYEGSSRRARSTRLVAGNLN